MKDNTTIYDVAKEAGVSTATVSRYLNRSSSIAKDKVSSIEKAIFDLGFRPRARSKSPNRTMRIGVIAASYETSYVTHILDGMDMSMYHLGYELIIETTQWKVEREERELRALIKSKVDGVIILAGALDEQIIKDICGKTPVVLVSRNPQGILPEINIDNELGGYIATNHLIQLGHRRIAHIHGPMSSVDAQFRLAGYKRAMSAAGIPIDKSLLIDGEYSEEGGFSAAKKLIEDKADFSAVFVANDVCSYGAIQALHQHNLNVPNDVSVIGFDDLPLSRFFIPRLTTIQQPFKEIGSIAIKYLIDLINGYKPKYDIPSVNLIVRDSCS